MRAPTPEPVGCTLEDQRTHGERDGWINIHSQNARVGKVRYALTDGALTIYSIMIFPEFQGRGYARQTIEMLKGRHPVLVADRVRPTARDFWRKMGFVERPDRSWEYTGAAEIAAPPAGAGRGSRPK